MDGHRKLTLEILTAAVLLTVGLFAPAVFCAVAQEKEVTIGIMTELTGPAAVNGANCKRGYDLAQRLLLKGDHLGRLKVKLVYGDTQGDAKTGISEFRRLVEIEGAQAIMLNRSQVGMAVNPISRTLKVPLLGILGHPAFVRDNPYAFRFFPSVPAEVEALRRYAVERGLKSIALLSLDDQWNMSFREDFLRVFNQSGGQMTIEETFSPGEIDFSAITARLRQTKPALIVVNLGVGQGGIAVKKIREAGLKQPIYGTYFTALPSEISTAGREAAEGLVSSEIDFRKPRFLEAISRLPDDFEPSAIIFTCYSAFAALTQALNLIAAQPDAASIFQALKKIDSIKVPDGVLAFQDREVRYDLSLVTVKDGRLVPFQN